MALLDRLERMTSLVLNVPSDVVELKVIIEQKAAVAEAALKREAVALEKAVTPEVEAALDKLENLLAHIPGLSALVAAHTAAEAATATPATEPAVEPAPTSDAVPTTAVL